MKFLFLHQSFPGQFLQLVKALAAQAEHEIIFLCRDGLLPPISGVKCYRFEDVKQSAFSHHYVQATAKAVSQGQAVYQAAVTLKKQGFYPDIIIGHSGWGCNLYMKDLFPKAKLVAYCEWFFHATNSEEAFNPDHSLSIDEVCLIRTANAPFLLDLATCDAAISPTVWQKSRFPGEYQEKITVIHDGIDTKLHAPNAETQLILPRIGLDLSTAAEIVTYVARGKDYYRGFPQFMEMLTILLANRPKCQVVIVGGDQVVYGPAPEGFANYKEMAQKTLVLDWNRVHFTGPLLPDEYRMVLQASSLHVYLTYPFVLSWSLMEAMASGCLVLASSTEPVREVITDGVTGFLSDFFLTRELAEKANVILDHQSELKPMREQARRAIVEKYDIDKTFPQQLQFLQDLWSNG